MDHKRFKKYQAFFFSNGQDYSIVSSDSPLSDEAIRVQGNDYYKV